MTESSTTKVAKNPEVTQKAARRRFTGEYKRRIALEAESCRQPGEIGALLRREGLLDDPYLVNRQFAAQRIEEMLEVDLRTFGYHHYLFADERREPLRVIREALGPR